MVEQLVRFVYLRCDRILGTSNAFFSSIENLGGDPNGFLYFPQSAESLYQPVVVELNVLERTILPSGFKVMFAGNIGAAQAFNTILDAAEKIKEYQNIHWVIIGDGRKQMWVEGQVKKRGLEKTFHLLGKYPVESMPRFFSLADVMLVTLKREPVFAITIPGKVQSYLACAKPIIAALDGEGARIIEEANAGLSCPAEDSDALAKAVKKMYHMSNDELENMGKSGRAYYSLNFERDMLIDRLVCWMEEVVKERV